MKKQLRVNKKYGIWYYEKEIDSDDCNNFVYHLSGIDENGREWFVSSIGYYNELIWFAKASNKDKEMFEKTH